MSCATSQCSTIFPFSSRKMSTMARPRVPGSRTAWTCRITKSPSAKTRLISLFEFGNFSLRKLTKPRKPSMPSGAPGLCWRYFGPKYLQHNPGAPDGIEGFRGFVNFLKEKFPNSKSEIKRVFAEGDFVILHVHAVREPGTRGRAIVDIFRLENGKIVEHWDVAQDIPEKAANSNGMF